MWALDPFKLKRLLINNSLINKSIMAISLKCYPFRLMAFIEFRKCLPSDKAVTIVQRGSMC